MSDRLGRYPRFKIVLLARGEESRDRTAMSPSSELVTYVPALPFSLANEMRVEFDFSPEEG